ncbi:hypothetical protein BUALT_Bualt12G0091800 [Buddleja alternifolia]|uniref:Uncharacterized protein n=1 Tax=Buddleja alternifolia TaxID=168488 RepID=A0AAV6WUN2_9LAMI|nr:hypothetical protein BUALT_Bualt12G0091800 [Buddleja alternifolia]
MNILTTHLVEFCEKIIETTVTSKASVAECWIQNTITTVLEQNGGNRIVGMGCKFKHHPIGSISTPNDNSQKLLKEYALSLNRKVDVHYLVKRWFPVSYKGRPSLKALAYGVAGLSIRKTKIVIIRLIGNQGLWMRS